MSVFLVYFEQGTNLDDLATADNLLDVFPVKVKVKDQSETHRGVVITDGVDSARFRLTKSKAKVGSGDRYRDALIGFLKTRKNNGFLVFHLFIGEITELEVDLENSMTTSLEDLPKRLFTELKLDQVITLDSKTS